MILIKKNLDDNFITLNYNGLYKVIELLVLKDHKSGASLKSICDKYGMNLDEVAGVMSKYKSYHVDAKTKARNHKYYLHKKAKNYSHNFYKRLRSHPAKF